MISFLSDIKPEDTTLFGGKGASLFRLRQAGMNVPDGFIIPSSLKSLESVQSEILEAFDNLDCPYVAVRSSANVEDGVTNSFAGQFETALYVDRENLLHEIQQCREFLFSDRMIAYCKAKGIEPDQIELSIVVQKMIASEISGVCFTKNPVSDDPDEMVIEACFGIGDALVSGKVTPDRYLINTGSIQKEISLQKEELAYSSLDKKMMYKPVEASRQNSQKLSDNQIQQLAKTCAAIATLYGMPMDIEWTYEKNQLYILQARPITTSAATITSDAYTLHTDEYEHLLDWGAPYFIAAIDQETFSAENGIPGRWDFISYGAQNKVAIHIAKNDREAMSRRGLELHMNHYDDYESKTRNDMKKMEQLTTHTREQLHMLSSKELADSFHAFIKQCYKVFENFDVTESVYTDSIEKTLQSEDISPDVLRLRKNIEKLGHFRLEQRALLNRVWDYQKGPLADFLQEIQTRVKLEYKPEDYHYMELLDLLYGKEVSVPDRTYWIRGKFSNWKDITGEEAKKLIHILSYIDTEATKILGTCSNKGLYTGRVRKIAFEIQTDYDTEIARMQKGEILLSGSTGPEMILACQKAGAIITDEGGVISHAAIISRELGIPCITGTHVACKILNTGDLVEVDATNGIIKILEKTGANGK